MLHWGSTIKRSFLRTVIKVPLGTKTLFRKVLTNWSIKKLGNYYTQKSTAIDQLPDQNFACMNKLTNSKTIT